MVFCINCLKCQKVQFGQKVEIQMNTDNYYLLLFIDDELIEGGLTPYGKNYLKETFPVPVDQTCATVIKNS